MAPAVRFYTDEHIPRGVIKGLRKQGINVLSASEAGLLGSSDEVHLERANLEGRVLVTLDADFLRLNAQGTKHCGIAFFTSQRQIGNIIQKLLKIHQSSNAKDLEGNVEYL